MRAIAALVTALLVASGVHAVPSVRPRPIAFMKEWLGMDKETLPAEERTEAASELDANETDEAEGPSPALKRAASKAASKAVQAALAKVHAASAKLHTAQVNARAAVAKVRSSSDTENAAPAMGQTAQAKWHAAQGKAHAAPSKELAAPATGRAAPSTGHAAPATGHAAPAKGHAVSARGHAPSAPGQAASAKGHAASAQEQAASFKGHAAAAKGQAAPAKGQAARAALQAVPAKGQAAEAEGQAAEAEGQAAEAEGHEMKKKSRREAAANHLETKLGFAERPSQALFEPMHINATVRDLAKATRWKPFLERPACKNLVEDILHSSNPLYCRSHAKITWSKANKFAYMRTPKAADISIMRHFYAQFPDARELGDDTLPEDVFLFTFVRDPFHHALAGYETIDRHLSVIEKERSLPPQYSFRQIPQSSANERFESFLFELEQGSFFGTSSLGQIDHKAAANQVAGIICQAAAKNINFIGHLESIETDWLIIQHLAKLPMHLRTTAIEVVHLSKSKQANLHADALSPAVYARYCPIYRADYKCLGYAQPMACRAGPGSHGQHPQVQVELKAVDKVADSPGNSIARSSVDAAEGPSHRGNRSAHSFVDSDDNIAVDVNDEDLVVDDDDLVS